VSNPKVFLFWDNSNIFISAKNVAQNKEGVIAKSSVRIHFANLFRLAVAGRSVGRAIVVGSIPPEQREVWDRMQQDIDVKPELYERGGVSGTEQGIDQCLQTHMLRAYADYEDDPQIAVLLSGDGAGYDVGTGFHADLERMHRNGWGIELIAWDVSCRRELKKWVTNVGQFICLEDYYESVTFLEGLRIAIRPSLRSRRKAVVGISRIEAERQKAAREFADYKNESDADRKKKEMHRKREKRRNELHEKKRKRKKH